MTTIMILAMTTLTSITPYTFNDALRDIVPGGKGKEAVREIVTLLDRTDVHYRSDPETDAFRKFMQSTMQNFDFMKLYESTYLKNAANGFRELRIQGCTTDNYYIVNLVTENSDRCEVSRTWDYSTAYALKKNDACIAGGRSFIVSIDSTTATGRYSHRNALSFVEGLLKIMDPANIRALNAPRCGLYGDIQGDSRRVIDEFCRQFPRVAEFFNRYSAVRSFLEIRKHNGIPYTSMSLRYGYRLDNLGKDFPELANSFSKVKGLYKINMKVKNSSNNTAMVIVFDSREDVLNISLYTRNGRIVPFDDAGNPVFKEELQLTAVRDLSYYAVVDMLHDVHGLKFTTDNMVIGFRYSSTPERGLWTMKLEDISKTRITGSYYNILPTWLIDAFIPSNMEQLVYDVSRVMLKAKGGSGSMVSFEWDTRDPDRVMLRFNAVSEFMDNYFIKYGLGVWSKGQVSNKKIFSEAKELTARFLGAFRADYGI